MQFLLRTLWLFHSYFTHSSVVARSILKKLWFHNKLHSVSWFSLKIFLASAIGNLQRTMENIQTDSVRGWEVKHLSYSLENRSVYVRYKTIFTSIQNQWRCICFNKIAYSLTLISSHLFWGRFEKPPNSVVTNLKEGHPRTW